MSELSVQKVELKKDWNLTPSAFDQLLNWLDEGRNSDGQKYLEMRSRLVKYFDRKNCRAPDDLADETSSQPCINRTRRPSGGAGSSLASAALSAIFLICK